MAASIVPAGEEAASTTTTRRLTSNVWDNYTINHPADGGAPTATCLECRKTLCAGSNNGTSHLRRHPKTKRCQKLAAERVELGRRQPTSSPTAAAAEPSSHGSDNGDYNSPSPPVVVEASIPDSLFTVDGIYIPELYDKLIAEGMDNIERSNVPAVPPQVASSKMMRFKERQVKRQKTGSDAHAHPMMNLNSKQTTTST